MTALRLAVVVLLSLPFALGGGTASADEGWEILRFHSDITIERDGALLISETIEVDFRGLAKRGIFREIPVRYRFDDTQDRVHDLSVIAVRDAAGRSWRYKIESEEANRRIRIGDPDQTVSGRQTYVITYRVAGALNAFSEHDELFWNVNGGDWGVPSRRVSAVVRGPAALTRTACFEGYERSTQACRQTPARDGAVGYEASRALEPGEQLTIVAALPKGAVTEPRVILDDRPRTIDRYFELTPLSLGLTGIVLAGGLALVGRNWWRQGRDRRFLKRTSMPDGSAEITAPLFDRPTLVPEYEPPDGLRPAQLGLIIDERADTYDLTATIVDLAVRGYLRIEKVEKQGLFGSDDWRLVRLAADPDLAPYEAALYEGLFGAEEVVLLSERKGKVAPSLQTAQRKLYEDAVERRWFTGHPERTRQAWAAAGCAITVAGIGLVFLLGATLGFGLVALGVIVAGLVLLVTHPAMARRSASGSELLRRTLGFRRYMETAEKDRAAFAEREGIFSAYLPYAIVFGCVDRWAKAFEGLDREAAAVATGGWYAGPGQFSAASFSNELSTFSSTVSSTIAYTPGSSGSSGFSGGGFSGGGGGGGGGGSW
ncbi:MAG: DUF2207 domain-containing protein [Chloroflexota bacterium]|nr:DUF2207 domain-containing protein [Chloroflexota bacterium]